ncbi:MAG: S9 family peptidase [Actinobacteria bacterium]|nr:MAG: S9 family peptidase [Actinomycetota bacterium]
MDVAGGVPEPMLPPQVALQNPELIGGHSFEVLPGLSQILVMIDRDGDENYEPFLIPIDGGFPEPLSAEMFGGRRSHLVSVDARSGRAYFMAESREESVDFAIRVDLETGEADTLWQSAYGAFPAAWTPDHSRVFLLDGYTLGDVVLYEVESGSRRMLHGTPLDERDGDGEYALSGIASPHGTKSGSGILLVTTIFGDTGVPGYLDLTKPRADIERVAFRGLVHEGAGELERLQHLEGDRYAAVFNIDGCSWAYEARLDEAARTLTVERILVGEGELAGGVLHGIDCDEESGRFALAFCTATMPTQLYVLEPDRSDAEGGGGVGWTEPPRSGGAGLAGAGAGGVRAGRRTRERALGLAPGLLAAGEDASFESHDGLRISARLYLPSSELGYDGPWPLVYYVHGGPQSQERPNFAWFSMPLIQILALEGFAVFVPNVRGSSGYGLTYTKWVDRDWGGDDRLDHVHAMTEVLPRDPRLDVERAGVVGRSYGGYMTLMLASRHPELWRAAVDMFGPYDLLTFVDRIPETWKPYFRLAVGDPEHDREFFVDRSPRSKIFDIVCPLLVIQGQNDPRVVEQESRDLVDELRGAGRDVDYLVFEDEGHDVLKLPNRVRCYERIVGFFSEHLEAV